VEQLPLSGPGTAELMAALSPQQRQKLESYLDHMLEVNKVMNLTGG
jgi:16S rRNA G527 N7-methylase RsmG